MRRAVLETVEPRRLYSATPIASGQTIGRNLGSVGQVDQYTFAAAEGDQVQLTANDVGVGNVLAPELMLNGPDGSLAGTAAGTPTSPATFSYTVPSGAGGSYTVSVLDALGTHAGYYDVQLSLTVPSPVIAINDAGTLNDTSNQVQRSEIRLVSLTFSTPVQIATGALSLQLWNSGGSGYNNKNPPFDVSTSLGTPTSNDGGYTWCMPFQWPGPETVVDATGSLVDGIYTVTLDGSKLSDASGNALSNPDASMNFHRLFGDINGDKQVSNADFFQFRKAFDTAAGDPGYIGAFDYNGDGTIGNLDYFQFRKRFLKQYTY